MITITFANSDAVRNALANKGPRIVQVLSSKLSALMIQLATYIVRNKLSGQVLKRRSGTLAGSIHPIPVRTEGTNIVSGVEGGGGPAFYGIVHEEGRTIMTVKARALSFMVDGKRVFAQRVTIPKRPFMRPSEEENADQIRNGLQTAMSEEVNRP